MTKRNTKQLILDAALRLFSERGYDGVGVRDIAKEVGIRESALYKHYKNKQDIFDSIILLMNKAQDAEMASFQLSERMMTVVNGEIMLENLIKMCVLMFHIYLGDERGAQLRRMLTFEQLKDTAIGKTFRDKLIDEGLNYIAQIFNELIKTGYYQSADPYVMAVQFYSPFYLLLTKYDRQSDKYDEALGFLEEHIKQFDYLHREGQRNER